jgi:hypothetical protein
MFMLAVNVSAASGEPHSGVRSRPMLFGIFKTLAKRCQIPFRLRFRIQHHQHRRFTALANLLANIHFRHDSLQTYRGDGHSTLGQFSHRHKREANGGLPVQSR